MYIRHRWINTPDNSQIIWRYMSLEKFISLLSDRALFFARQDKFDDIKEGMRSTYDLSVYDEFVPGISKQIENDKHGCGFINCWTMSDVDLYLMWSAYASLDKGIAIKSSVGNLIDSFDPKDNRGIYISAVQYIDYDKESTFNKSHGSANDLARYFCKRNYFCQENELRSVYYDYAMKLDKDNKTFGVIFDVSLDTLIEEIFIAPKADDWFFELVKKVIDRYQIQKPLYRSQI